MRGPAALLPIAALALLIAGCAPGTQPKMPDIHLPVISDADKMAALECAVALVPAGVANPAMLPIAAAATPACRLLAADVLQFAIAKAREKVMAKRQAMGLPH